MFKNKKFRYSAPSQYPSINRDIALQVTNSIAAQDLINTIWKNGGDYLLDVNLFDVYQSEDVGDLNKSLAFSLKFQSSTTTLKDAVVDNAVKQILKVLEKKHDASQR